MSLSRAFTMRSSSKNSRDTTPPTSPKRAISKRKSKNDIGQSVNKYKISAPVELISTTNMISYTSPSLRSSLNGTSGNIGLGLVQEEPYPPSPASSGSLPPLTPDVGPNLDDILTPPATPPPNHLTEYFPKRNRGSGSTSSNSAHNSTQSIGIESRHIPRIRSVSSIKSNNSFGRAVIEEEESKEIPALPEIPKRSPSTRSVTSPTTSVTPIMSPTYPSVPSKSNSRVHRSASASSLRSKPRHSKSHSTNPFAQELAQVSELAEDMGLDLDEDHMEKHNLCKFSVNDYLMEIHDVMYLPPKGLKQIIASAGSQWI